MLVGHYGAALAAKALEPRVPLWALLLAVMWVDVLWAMLVLTGIERARYDPSLAGIPLALEHMPFTHGLAATVVWTAAAFLVLRAWAGRPRREAAAVAGAVGSHWLLDLPVHRPDLPLVWGEPKLGLALWDRPAVAAALELAWLLAAAALLARSGGLAPRRVWGLALGLVALQAASTLGATPRGLVPVVVGALVVFLAVPVVGARLERRPDVTRS